MILRVKLLALWWAVLPHGIPLLNLVLIIINEVIHGCATYTSRLYNVSYITNQTYLSLYVYKFSYSFPYNDMLKSEPWFFTIRFIQQSRSRLVD